MSNMSPDASGTPSSSAVELQPYPTEGSISISEFLAQSDPANASSRPESQRTKNGDPAEFLPQPSTTVGVVERWNHPRINLYRTFATFFGFLIMGANDAAYGALIPYLEYYYHLSYVVVSLVFLSPLAGYAGAAILNNTIHVRFGQRGVAFIGPFCHLAAYLGIALHPPYPVLVIVFILAGFGNGLEDAAWNAWIGNMANANEILGFLHGFYGLGAVLSPLIATTLITKAGWPWYAFYYIMLGGAVIELVTSLAAFWQASATVYREGTPRHAAVKGSRLQESLSSRVTWVTALFLLGYVGAEVALGGWIVTFMIRERSGEAFASGMVATGFWMGITVGRFVLGFVTPRLGEKLAITIYLPLTMALQLIFWLVPQFYVSAIAVSLQGFFLGPLFPAAIAASTKLLPAYLHVSAIGFAAAMGGGGAAIFPFAVGAVAQSKGVQVLQPIVLILLVVLLLLWLSLPKMNKRNEEIAQAEGTTRYSWTNFDVDLVDTGTRIIKKSRASLQPTQVAGAIREARENRADKKFAKQEIKKIVRETPPFAVLQGVEPDSNQPPPYTNVRIDYGSAPAPSQTQREL